MTKTALKINITLHHFYKVVYPPLREARSEVANLSERKNTHTQAYGTG
jgi:hypothetical protein